MAAPGTRTNGKQMGKASMTKKDLQAAAFAVIIVAGITYYLIPEPEESTVPDSPSARKRAALVARAALDVDNDVQRRVWLDVNPDMVASPHWCQAWVLHQYRLAGLTKATWKMGGSFPILLVVVDSPKPGDMAYWPARGNHGAMVESFKDGKLVTLDGAGHGNMVRRVYHTPESVKPVFLSIERLL